MQNKKKLLTYAVVGLIFYGIVQFLISFGLMNTYYSNTLFLIGINIILATSLNLINGVTGQFSIGHAGFMSVGAYVSAIFTLKFEMPFIVALIVGAIVAALAGLLVGLPTLRLKGDYLAIATLGFGEIIRIFFLTNEYVGGASGLNGIPHLTNWTWIFFTTVISVIIIYNFMFSTHGRACVAIRENEIAAETMGINTTRYKVIAFVMGAFFAGIAGGLFAHNFYIIQPNVFSFLKSIDILVMVVLGGLGSLTGSIFAAVGLTFISMLLQQVPELRMVVYAVVLILVMLYRPQGLMGNKELTNLSFLLPKKRGMSNE